MTEEANIYASPDAIVADRAGNDLFGEAIGPNNRDFYLSYIDRAAGRGWVASWNWPAFFFTSMWLLYRKMWAVFLIYTFALPVLLITVVGVLGALVGEVAGAVVNLAGGLALMIALPAYANALYLRKLQSLVSTAEQTFADEASQRAWLGEKGGTTWMWVLVILIPFAGGLILALSA